SVARVHRDRSHFPPRRSSDLEKGPGVVFHNFCPHHTFLLSRIVLSCHLLRTSYPLQPPQNSRTEPEHTRFHHCEHPRNHPTVPFVLWPENQHPILFPKAPPNAAKPPRSRHQRQEPAPHGP